MERSEFATSMSKLFRCLQFEKILRTAVIETTAPFQHYDDGESGVGLKHMEVV